MRSIKELKNIKGKIALVRVDFNVPMKDGKVEDDFRIQKALPTIQFLQKKGAKIILIAHLGKGGETLAPVAKVLNKYVKATFVPEIIGEKASKAVADMKNGEVVLLENLRNDAGEQSLNNFFAMNLAKLADFYVNEAFSVSHREDTSLVLLPKLLPSYAGLQLQAEIKNLSKAIKDPKHPFLFILGGAKFSTKMPLIKKYLRLADAIFIGGALLNDFLKAKGYQVGKSLIDEGDYSIEKIIKNKKLIIPEYVVVKNADGKFEEKNVRDISKNDVILDVGKESLKILEPVIKKSKLILWNGPLGKYEAGAGGATKEVLKMVAAAKAESIIGGGDTVEIISELKLEDKFSFVSTGGGATLDFLANGTLPGIKALK
ncbi:MAG: phosphoglycerate kinase [Patescibacteria group bacterium]